MKRFSIGYAILKPWTRITAEFFYRKFTITGLQNFPKRDVPVILAANHQNALMDAMVCCITAPRQLSFLTRADIFQNPTAYRILTHLNMLPIYRQRDKVDQIALNEVIFRECYARLRAGGAISLFPEGGHNNKKFLRPFRKGLARVAFGAEESGKYDLDLQIIPVGMDFSNYTDFRADLLVQYGEPISIKPYLELYKNEPGRAYTELMQEVKQKLSKIVIDIHDRENYNLIRKLEPLIVSEKIPHRGKVKLMNRWKVFKDFTDGWNRNFKNKQPQIDEMNATFSEYEKELKSANFSVEEFEVERAKPVEALFRSLGLLLGLPLFLAGLLLNFAPAWVVSWYVKNKVRDLHFKSSIKMALGMFVFPLFWIVVVLIVGSIIGSWKLGVLLLILAPLSGIIAVHWKDALKRLRLELRLRQFAKRRPEKSSKVSELRRQILNLTDSIIG